jgi:hypothetical protein
VLATHERISVSGDNLDLRVSSLGNWLLQIIGPPFSGYSDNPIDKLVSYRNWSNQTKKYHTDCQLNQTGVPNHHRVPRSHAQQLHGNHLYHCHGQHPSTSRRHRSTTHILQSQTRESWHDLATVSENDLTVQAHPQIDQHHQHHHPHHHNCHNSVLLRVQAHPPPIHPPTRI